MCLLFAGRDDAVYQMLNFQLFSFLILDFVSALDDSTVNSKPNHWECEITGSGEGGFGFEERVWYTSTYTG